MHQLPFYVWTNVHHMNILEKLHHPFLNPMKAEVMTKFLLDFIPQINQKTLKAITHQKIYLSELDF